MAVKQAVIESGRAEEALKAVKKVIADYPYDAGKDKAELTEQERKNMQIQKEYKSYARKFSPLVLTNGLAAAIAFANEKGRGNDKGKDNDKDNDKGKDNGKGKDNDNGSKAWSRIYTNISDWLIQNNYFEKPNDLLEYVCSLDSDNYRLVTGEVLALFGWLRRFAGGLIEGEAE